MRQGVVHGYIRVSTEDQADGGLSLDTQRALVRGEWERVWKAKGYEFGRVYEDRAISGSKDLRCRPAGLQLSTDAEPGDVILFPKLDRGFRSTKDMLTTVDIWAERGVNVVFLDLQIDYATTIGRMMLTILAAGAEFERQRASDRTREVLAHARRQGKRIGGPPFGVRVIGPKGKRQLVVTADEYEVGRQIVAWRLKNLPFESILHHLRKHNVLRPARKSGPQKGKKRQWTLGSVFRAYRGTLKVMNWIEAGTLKAPVKKMI